MSLDSRKNRWMEMNPDEFLKKAKNPTDHIRLPKTTRVLEELFDESSHNSNMPKIT